MLLKGSQFIDYLQTYIVELNTTPQKRKQNKSMEIKQSLQLGDFNKKKISVMYHEKEKEAVNNREKEQDRRVSSTYREENR